MKYKTILLKLSGESLMGDGQYGIDPKRLEEYAQEIKTIYDQDYKIAIVIGGGNIYRGLQGASAGMDRVQGDYMGMLATVINSMALQGALETAGIPAKVLGGLTIEPITEKMSRRTAKTYLDSNHVVIVSGGTGNPFFTTDTASALRAVEIEADVLLKGTRVDGIYTADPEKDPSATKYEHLTFDEAYSKGLKIMDLTAFTLCKENNIEILVFDMNKQGNLKKVLENPLTGTRVHN